MPPTILPPSAPAWRNCAESARGGRLLRATYSGTCRCTAPEACAGRRQRSAQGRDGSTNPAQVAARLRFARSPANAIPDKPGKSYLISRRDLSAGPNDPPKIRIPSLP
jgi:hypothetical protein